MANKYAGAGKIAINGGSNGGKVDSVLVSKSNQICLGLLVAACVNRAPEALFGAAVAEVGVLDLLKVWTNSHHYTPEMNAIL